MKKDSEKSAMPNLKKMAKNISKTRRLFKNVNINFVLKHKKSKEDQKNSSRKKSHSKRRSRPITTTFSRTR